MPSDPSELNAVPKQLLKFIVVGASNTLVDIGSFTALKFVVPWLIAQIVSYSLGVLNSFVWNRLWTFEKKGKPQLREALTFVLVNLVSFGVSTGLLALGIEILHWDPILSKVFATVLAMSITFIGSRLVFLQDKRV